MGIKVTPQVVWILDQISAKVPQTNTHLHMSHDHSAAFSIQSIVQDFELDLEFFKLDIPGLLPADDNDNDEPSPFSKHACFMTPSTNCWDKEDLIIIYGSKADIDTEIADATRLTDNLSFKWTMTSMSLLPSCCIQLLTTYYLTQLKHSIYLILD